MACLVGLFNSSVTRAPLSSRSGAGDPVYGTQVSIRARVERKQQRIMSADGEPVDAQHVFWTDQTVSISDGIWLSDDDADNDPARKIVDLKITPSIDGTVNIYEAAL